MPEEQGKRRCYFFYPHMSTPESEERSDGREKREKGEGRREERRREKGEGRRGERRKEKGEGRRGGRRSETGDQKKSAVSSPKKNCRFFGVLLFTEASRLLPPVSRLLAPASRLLPPVSDLPSAKLPSFKHIPAYSVPADKILHTGWSPTIRQVLPG